MKLSGSVQQANRCSGGLTSTFVQTAMKVIILSLSFFLVSANLVYPQQEKSGFNLRYYGNFKKKLIEQKLAGNVELEQALSAPHIYGVGMIKNAEGEITVIDGDIWLNYGKDGIRVTRNRIPSGEKAALLITAQVENWQKIIIPNDMSANELYAFIRGQAKNLGLNTKLPFPFLIEGNIKDLVWDVLNGIDVEPTQKGDQVFLRKLVEYREETRAILVGFYAAELRNDFSYPGQLWHVHVLFRDEKITGHASTFSVTKGAYLELPIR